MNPTFPSAGGAYGVSGSSATAAATDDFQRLLAEVEKLPPWNQQEKLKALGRLTSQLPANIQGHALIHKFNSMACDGPAGDEVKAGGNVREIAERYGLTDIDCQHALGGGLGFESDCVEAEEAEEAEEVGQEEESVQIIEADYGPRSGLSRLEEIAAKGKAGLEVADGANVQDVAHKYGIRTEGFNLARKQLTWTSVLGPGERAVLAGGRAADFLDAHGIDRRVDAGQHLLQFEKKHSPNAGLTN